MIYCRFKNAYYILSMDRIHRHTIPQQLIKKARRFQTSQPLRSKEHGMMWRYNAMIFNSRDRQCSTGSVSSSLNVPSMNEFFFSSFFNKNI